MRMESTAVEGVFMKPRGCQVERQKTRDERKKEGMSSRIKAYITLPKQTRSAPIRESSGRTTKIVHISTLLVSCCRSLIRSCLENRDCSRRPPLLLPRHEAVLSALRLPPCAPQYPVLCIIFFPILTSLSSLVPCSSRNPSLRLPVARTPRRTTRMSSSASSRNASPS